MKLWDKGYTTDALITKFTVGNDYALDQAFVPYDCIGSAAHAKMLLKTGILNESEAVSLLDGLGTIFDLAVEGKFPITLEQEDCHTAIEEWLTKNCGDAGKKIHTGRSRNDQVLTAVRLYLRQQVSTQTLLLLEVASALAQKYEKFGHLPLAGYTHLQQAMPSSIGMWLQAFRAHALSLVQEGYRLFEGLNVCPLGAASGFGVPFDLQRNYTAELLGFSGPQINPVDIQNSRGRFEQRFLNWNAEIGSMLEKFAWDGVLFFSKEFGYFKLPNEFTTGSSIMPQKRNPDVFELLRAKGARQKAHATELASVTSKLPSNYFRDYQLTKEPLLRSVMDVSECLCVMTEVILVLGFDEEKLKGAMSDELYATYEVYRRVGEGETFREAYKAVGELFLSGSLDVSKAKVGFEIVQAELDRGEKSLSELQKSLSESPVPQLPDSSFSLGKTGI